MTLSTAESPIGILLVDDNPADVELTERAVRNATYTYNVTVAEDGELTMVMLGKQEAQASTPRPDAILLDLKVPNKDGWDVMSYINEDPDLKDIPIMLLMTLQAESPQLAESGIYPSRYCDKDLQTGSASRPSWKALSGPVEF